MVAQVYLAEIVRTLTAGNEVKFVDRFTGRIYYTL
jgi:hypothetical protein